MKLIDVLTAPWAIQPDKLAEIQEIYATHLRGDKIDIGAVENRLGRQLLNEHRGYDVIDGVAVLPIEGVSAKKANLFMQVSGGVSTELVARDLRAALADDNVHSIILAIDSPGGQVDGTQSLAAQVRQASQQKPIVSLANGMMASAAYWYGSAAQQRYIADGTTTVGSIGVIARHVDLSGARAAQGVRETLIVAGKYKAVGSDHAPLSDSDRATMQERVDYLYSLFIADVAAHLGRTPEQVHADMADGRVFTGQQAIAVGLVDGVATTEQLVEQLNRNRSAGARSTVGGPLPPTKTGATSMPITRDQLQADAPELLQALLAEGATAERARIQAVENAALPGHEALIAKLKFDGRTSGDQAAMAVLQAERQLRSTAQQQLATDAPAPVKQAATPTVDAGATAAEQQEAGQPVEERCKARWERDAAVRGEFGTLAAYTAFTRAEESGRVKRLTGKAAA